jgi:hypothetical protein
MENFISKTAEEYKLLIGLKCKKTSNKPFKSTFWENTIKNVIQHPVLHIPAFTFNEDESYVECRRCIIINN